MKYALVAAVFIALRDVFSSKIARKYNLKVLPVVKPKNIESKKFIIKDKAFTENGILFNC